MAKLNTKTRSILLGGSLGVLGAAALTLALLLSGPGTPLDPAVSGNDPRQPSLPPLASDAISISTPAPDFEKLHEEELLLLRSRLTMLEGTKINGVDVGNMTLEQAREAVSASLTEETLPDIAMTLFHEGGKLPEQQEDKEDKQEEEEQEAPILFAAVEGGVLYTPNKLNIKLVYDIEAPLEAAFGLLRDESLSYEEAMAEKERIKTQGQSFDISYLPEEESLRFYLEEVSFLTDTPAQNSAYDVNPDTHKLMVTESVDGIGMDIDSLLAALLELDPTKESRVTLPMKVLKGSEAGQEYVLRGSYKTNFKSSSSNRKFNIRKGCELINGTILKPGEVFSTNAKLGQRTKKNGWKNAPAYVSGKHEDQPGGGVCQLSSTLFNAAVYADLEIVDRRNHSMPVSYVEKGRDATINSVGNIIDFKFKNNTEGDIIILSYTVGNDLYFDLYGLPMENERYDKIEIKAKRLSTIKPTTNYTEDPTKDADYEKETYEGCTGYRYITYKYYYKDGKLIDELTESWDSNYKMYPREVTVGTKPIEDTAEPTKTPKPTKTPDAGEPQNTPKPTKTPEAETPVPETPKPETPKPEDDTPGE